MTRDLDRIEREAELARARSQDAQRVRRMVRIGQALGDDCGEPDRVVPCRRCKAPTPMSGFAVWCAKRATEYLVSHGLEGLYEGQVMLCRDCRLVDQREHEAALAELDARFREIVRAAKDDGKLGEAHRRWLIDHGHREVVEALEQRFARDAEKRAARRGGRRGEDL